MNPKGVTYKSVSAHTRPPFLNPDGPLTWTGSQWPSLLQRVDCLKHSHRHRPPVDLLLTLWSRFVFLDTVTVSVSFPSVPCCSHEIRGPGPRRRNISYLPIAVSTPRPVVSSGETLFLGADAHGLKDYLSRGLLQEPGRRVFESLFSSPGQHFFFPLCPFPAFRSFLPRNTAFPLLGFCGPLRFDAIRSLLVSISFRISLLPAAIDLVESRPL